MVIEGHLTANKLRIREWRNESNCYLYMKDIATPEKDQLKEMFYKIDE